MYEYPSMSFAPKHPALLLSKHQRSLHTWFSVAVATTPNRVPTKTHLLRDPQPQTDQIGIIHDVPVRESGSFGAARCPLKDTRHYAAMPPFPRTSHVCSQGQSPRQVLG